MKTVFPTEREARRNLRKFKELRRREERLGYNLETGYPTRTVYISINVEAQ